MKTITINPRPFFQAQDRADWFKDPGAIKDWDTTFAIIKKLGFTQVRYKIGLNDIFGNLSGATVPFVFMDSPDLWLRRIEPVLKYCAVYNMKLLLVIDDVSECIKSWGATGVSNLIQQVIDRVGNRAKYTFDSIHPSNWTTTISAYNQVLHGVNFKGNELQSPPMLVTPFMPWEDALSQFIVTPFASKCQINSVNIYVDRRYSTNHIKEYSNLLINSKKILSTSKKPYVIQETGLCPKYAQVDDISRGEMLLKLEQLIYKVGGFRDYGIYSTHDQSDTPPGEQFSILNPNVLLGYLKGGGYSPAIVTPTKNMV